MIQGPLGRHIVLVGHPGRVDIAIKLDTMTAIVR